MFNDPGGNYCVAERPRNPDTDVPEGRFRGQVRDILNLDPFTHDQRIFDELRRLKRLDPAGGAEEVGDITDADIKEAKGYDVLGPAYFSARRVAEALMQGVESEPLAKVVKKCADDLTNSIYEYIENGIRADLEQSLQEHICHMIERTIRALLSGESWAMKQYPLAKYHDGEAIRAAVAKHGGEPLLMMRITDLEATVTRLSESLAYAVRR